MPDLNETRVRCWTDQIDGQKWGETPYTRAWQRFLNGKWVRQIPQREGLVPIADSKGDFAGFVTVKINSKTQAATVRGCLSWQKWYWSEAIPGMPEAEEWEDVKEKDLQE